MNLKLRALENLEEALGFAELLEARAQESRQAYTDEPLPKDAMRRFLERSFQRPETLVLLAESEELEGPNALCITAPLEDPLSGEALPVIVGLWVQERIRHRGVARAMVREVNRLLSARGIGTLAARTGHNDDALISMGERWGFVRSWELMVLD